MKVIMHSTLAHPDYAASAGQTVNLPDAVARDLVASGYASTIDDPHPRRRDGANPATTSSQPAATDTVKAILDWVGDDRERAALALETEQGNTKPRVTLTNPLGAMLAAPASDQVPQAIAALDAQKENS